MKYDLLVTDGEVLDPEAGLKGQLDVAISGGKIVEVAASLPKNEARRTISARGLLVTPGLVDIHAHISSTAHDMGGHTDHFCSASGVTTLCDAGSTGSATFAGLRHVIDHQVRTRTRAFVNLSAIGIVGTLARRRAVAFPLCRPGGLRPHDRREPGPGDRRQAALRAGAGVGIHHRAGQAGAPHRRDGWRAADDPHPPIRRSLCRTSSPRWRPGDIITHCYPRPRQRHHGPGKTIRAEGGRRGAALWDHLRLRPWAKPISASR